MQLETKPFNGTADEWDAFVTAQPAASASHLYAWKRVIERVYQHDCPYLAAVADSQLQGVLPLVDVRSMVFGRFMVSMPYLNAGGPLGSARAVDSLSQAAAIMARQRAAGLLEFRCTGELNVGLEGTTEKVACVLPLSAEPGEIWSAMKAKLRGQIRRPGKAGVEMRFGPEELKPFFAVFARNMRDLGSPTHPYEFFRAISDELGERAWFGCAYYQGKPVAAGCAIQWRDEVEMTWASSLRSHNNLAPNMLLYWSFIERAAALGTARFNFGRCTPNTGSHRFKQQWGTIDEPLYWYRANLGGLARAPHRDLNGLNLATRVWQHVPLSLATIVGPRLRRGIPA